MWDLRLKLSPASRTLAECDRYDPNNTEFTISLLDCRYLAGDRDLFRRLHDKVIPKLVMRESKALLQGLAEVTRERHAKYGMTLYHLEPNLKEAPGGLRDCNVASWLALISAMDKLHDWPDASSLRAPVRKQLDAALDFLMSARCFLHFRHGRDDNTLSWEAQDEAAARKIGARRGSPRRRGLRELSAADWMRIYFGHARAVQRTVTQLLEEIPEAWSALYRQVQSWRSRLTTPDFSVVDGLIFLQQPSALQDPEVLLRLFHFMAHHGLKLSATTEYRIEQALPALASMPPRGAELWLYLQETLLQPHAADALRAMHSLRLLTLLLPELKLIDSLVVRDFYHRFTVDEHSFLAIESLHRLKQSQSEWDKRYAELLGELEDPELLYLALLLHDTGKGVPGGNHVEASLEIANRAMDRLDVDPKEREEVLFLIGESSGIVGGAAARHFQSGDRGGVRGKDGHARAAEDALPADLRRHQGGEPGGADAVEGGKRLAALHGRRELSEPQRRPARACRRERRKAGALAVAGSGDQQQVQRVSGRIPAALSAGAYRRRSDAAHGDGRRTWRRSGAG